MEKPNNKKILLNIVFWLPEFPNLTSRVLNHFPALQGRLDLRNQVEEIFIILVELLCGQDEGYGMWDVGCGMWGKGQCKASWRNISSFRLKIAYQGQKQLKFYNQPPTRIQLTYDNAKVLTGKWPSYGGDRTDLCHCLSASVVTCFVRTRYGQHCSQTTDVLLFYFGTRAQVPPATCIQSQSKSYILIKINLIQFIMRSHCCLVAEKCNFLTQYCSSVKVTVFFFSLDQTANFFSKLISNIKILTKVTEFRKVLDGDYI
ncbi:hypothetical protein T01_6580 [Trichinella spiralis]|uniref:Uncharacterized protein n=1 Tax=Trichinella spiralis TaxID=6334 RepID=A0A0V1C131_TRISP|nr:hypothetical protein T01_6580 [Trichinella spiralis]